MQENRQLEASDDENDDLSGDTATVSNDAQAYAHVDSILQKQAVATASRSGKRVPGDIPFRTRFLTLLRAADQRRMFMQFVSVAANVHRTAALFGQPPYAFLLPSDASMLSAAMLGASRRNMCKAMLKQHQPEAVSQIPSTANFGAAHYVDSSSRQFRVFSTAMDRDDGAGGFFVRRAVKKRDLQVVIRIRKVGGPKEQRMPMLGEQLNLSLGRAIKKLDGMRGASHVVGTVSALALRSHNSATALLRVRVDAVSDTLQ